MFKGDGWEICTTSSVRGLHSAVSKYVRRDTMLLSRGIPVDTVCSTLKKYTN